jgi:uncharacterized protein with von Willebrand factor type A (vWA) domain
MKVFLYSRWDGTAPEFSLDADDVLRAASELMMHGLSLPEALEWMRRYGLSMDGLDFRVMGVDELLEELRNEIEALQAEHHLDEATRELAGRLDAILDREQAALVEEHGHESAALRDFLERRHADARSLSARIERMRGHDFADGEAEEEFRELLDELDELRSLEEFVAKNAGRFYGPNAADYETAQEIRRKIEALEAMAESLSRGELDRVSPEDLARMLSQDAARSLVFLRDAEQRLKESGYAAGGAAGLELTPRAIRKIGAHALADVYGALQKDRAGEHDTSSRGASLPRPDETRPYAFGDPLRIDVTRSLMNAVRRTAAHGGGGMPLRLRVEDLEVREHDTSTDTTTVLLLDLSWSMSFGGRFPAAKRVALALAHLVRTAYPRDRLHVVGFSTRARELSPRDLSEVRWDAGDPFTNLQAGLVLAEELIARSPSPSAQVIVVTDGQPTAYSTGRELHAEWPMGPGAVSPRAVAATMKQVHRITQRGVTINTFMLDDAPELVGFVERMTEVNHGRAFFTAPEQLGSFLLVDYVAQRRRRR